MPVTRQIGQQRLANPSLQLGDGIVAAGGAGKGCSDLALVGHAWDDSSAKSVLLAALHESQHRRCDVLGTLEWQRVAGVFDHIDLHIR